VFLFEDNFDSLSPKWVKTGSHPNFDIGIADGNLNLKLDWIIPPETEHESPWGFPQNSAGVYYKEPFNLLRKQLSVKVDMIPRSDIPFYPGLQYWSTGVMVANKTMPLGVDIGEDPELRAIMVIIRYISGTPADVLTTSVFGYTVNPLRGRVLTGYPPATLRMDFHPTTVKMYESDVLVGETTPNIDLSKSYVYLITPATAEVSKEGQQYLCPSDVFYDYVKIEDLPPEPIMPVAKTALYSAAAVAVLMLNATLLYRGIRMVRR